MAENGITIKSLSEIAVLREAGEILSGIVSEIKSSLTIGITTQEIDEKAERLIQKHNVLPAFKGYRGFPKCVCVSVNDQVVHGIPGNRILKDGDIVSIDIGIIYKEYYSDQAVTVGLGAISPELNRLIEVTRTSLYKGIEQARENNHLSDISHAVQTFVEQEGFSVVREFVGHGIGRRLHEEPEIPNYGPPGQGPVLKEGMILAIEPMVNMGAWQTKVLNDGWTVVTKDGKPSAHYEHTVAIGKNGPEILTEE